MHGHFAFYAPRLCRLFAFGFGNEAIKRLPVNASGESVGAGLY